MSKKLIYGVGVNNADYVTNPRIDGKLKKCKIYQTWTSMLERCYSASYIEKRPTYKKCSVAKEWHHFMAFREWMLKQDYEGKQLDKDLLSGVVYSINTCVFISRQLNNFMTESNSSRGALPVGVATKGDKFRAQCRNPFTNSIKYLGVFSTPEEAHLAWRQFKHELALEYAKLETDPRIIEALQNRYK